MTEALWRRRLAGFLGAAFILFGFVETGVAIAGSATIGFFWFPALCGGGALILLGEFVVKALRLSTVLVIVGSLAGGLATAWTVVAPILAVVLIVLVFRRNTAGAVGEPVAVAE